MATSVVSPAESSPFLSREQWTCYVCGATEPKGVPVRWVRSGPDVGKKYHPSCTPAAPVAAAPVAAPAASSAVPGDALAGLLAGALLPHIQEQLHGKVDANAVRDIAQAMIDEQFPIMAQAISNSLKRELNPVVTIEVKRHDGARVPMGLVHKSFSEALEVAADRDNLYLFGPRGSGKTEMAQQIAKALDLKFYTVQLNQQTSESKIAGLRDAMGVVHSTPFIDAYRDGGVFYLSEADNASGNLLTGLNTALGNDFYTTAFGETIRKHVDFVFIADGNTAGNGQDTTYSSRGRLDGATTDRWVYVHVPYDADLERTLALAQNPNAGPWVDWVASVRRYAETNKITDITPTPRASIKGARKLATSARTLDAIANQLVFKGVQINDPAKRDKIMSFCPFPTIKREVR